MFSKEQASTLVFNIINGFIPEKLNFGIWYNGVDYYLEMKNLIGPQ